MSIFFSNNGQLQCNHASVLGIDNRSFRYGDGLFETIKVINGKIVHADLHFTRLFGGMAILKFNIPPNFTRDYFEEQIKALLEKNNHTEAARVRLSIFRGEGNLKGHEETKPGFVLQSWMISPDCGEWIDKGLTIDVYRDAVKPCDKFSALKTNNFLAYAMASIYASENKLNDALLLNQYGRICDSSIANIFVVKDKQVFTPPLSEGCIAGVYRKYLLTKLPLVGIDISEKSITQAELLKVDAVFLTNSIHEIRWVSNFQNTQYEPDEVFKLYSLLAPTI